MNSWVMDRPLGVAWRPALVLLSLLLAVVVVGMTAVVIRIGQVAILEWSPASALYVNVS